MIWRARWDGNKIDDMQNPAEKKRFAWGWVALGCGGLAVIALVAAVVIIFKTVPAVQSALANLDQAFSQAPTSPSSPTALPDTGPGPDSSAGSLPFKFSPMQGLSMAASQ